MAEQLGDLLIFVSIVAVLVVVGLVLGMLVAGRIDRLMAPRPALPVETAPPPGDHPDTSAGMTPDPTSAEEERA